MTTAEELLKLLDYDPATGVFVWLEDRPNGIRAGSKAGSVTVQGYVRIRYRKQEFYAHRLAIQAITGKPPVHEVDHINGDKADNRAANLRDVPHILNTQNVRAATKANRAGFLGVGFDKLRSKWTAVLRVNGRSRLLGRFKTPEEAHEAYIAAKRVHHAGCTI